MRIIASEVNEGNRVSFEKVTQIQQNFGIETEVLFN
jgi:hypothetical protein